MSPSHPSRAPSQKQATVASALRTPRPPPRGRALFPSELDRWPSGRRPRQLHRAHPERSPRRRPGSESSTDGKALVRGDCGCRVCDVLPEPPQSPEMEFRSCAREEARRCLCEDLHLIESPLHPPVMLGWHLRAVTFAGAPRAGQRGSVGRGPKNPGVGMGMTQAIEMKRTSFRASWLAQVRRACDS